MVETQTKDTQVIMTPLNALERLKDGNRRFVANRRADRDLMQQVRATGSGQYPFAIVLGCVDSRVPPELVFDQGIGDIFSARIAGNFVNDDILGSMEFAAKVAGARLIVVLGHTSCGAIMGAIDDVQMGNLTLLLDNLKPAVEATEEADGKRTSENAVFVQAVAEENVRLTLEDIKQRSPVLNEMLEGGEIALVGGMYDVQSGEVEFFD